MALGALSMVCMLAGGVGALQRVAFGGTELGDDRFHFRAPGGLIRDGAASARRPRRCARKAVSDE